MTMRGRITLTVLACGLMMGVPVMTTNEQQAADLRQQVIEVTPASRETSAPLAALIADIRAKADGFVFISGGASKMREEDQKRLLGMIAALGTVAKSRRIAVGDGGTRAGIMEAAGTARQASGAGFPLIGVVPSAGVPPRGEVQLDPNHSHIVKVDDPSASAQDAWGSETPTMYWLFAKLTEGRPSVTVVANGGGITLSEVDANVRAGRRMIVIAGSGRAANAIVASLVGTKVSDPEIDSLQARVEELNLLRRRDLFQVVELKDGAEGLRKAIESALGAAK
jgi:hypothetical protein